MSAYEEARANAQRLANDAARLNPEYARVGGCDWGIAKNVFGWSVWRLPLPRNRYGADYTCEVVTPEVWS